MHGLTNDAKAIGDARKAQSRRDHLTVFREFLAHLDRAARHTPPRLARARAKARSKR
jgi:hypothetical protein